jgi:uncharacterized delta-60 repeat protein
MVMFSTRRSGWFRWLRLCMALALVLANGTNLLAPPVAYAADGDLDPSFGSGGMVTTAFNGGPDYAYALAIQSDDKIVVAGSAVNAAVTAYDFALARYTITGTLDGSFGSGGKVTTEFNGTGDWAFALAIQSDGKIVAAGQAWNPAQTSFDFALARYNANGTLDGSFGSGGKVTTAFNGQFNAALALGIQSDGKIVVAGFAYNAAMSATDFVLARYNANGTLDGSFGTAGKVTTDFNGTGAVANALGIQSDGKIVVAGQASNAAGTSGAFALARYNANGTLDMTFDSDGKVTTDFNGKGVGASALAIQSDGKIVAAGSAYNAAGTSLDFALARYNANGTLDGTFNGTGTVTTDFNGQNETRDYALAIQSDGKIVAAGETRNAPATQDFALARYTITGTLDMTFGSGGTGKVTTDFNGKADSAVALGIQSDGKLVAAGYASNAAGNSQHFALARYENDLTLPLIFVHGVAGSTLVKNGSEIWLGVPGITSRRELSQIDSPPANVIATDAIRTALHVNPIYGPLLDFLTTTGGYVEYNVNGDPARRTTAGCDTSQAANKPKLFVFAYDWRVDNDANADKLQDYIGCVQTFYPGSKVNLLAHSMGGVLARRYILKYYDSAQPNNGHQVNALISIGSPFLGAPKMLYVLETGEFIASPPIATGPDVKYAAETLTAAHQLGPSRRYSDVSGVVPLAENGWDLNANGIPSETYSYDDLLAVMNIRYPNTPGATGDTFHSYSQPWGGQDDWSADTTGVKYYHIYGVRGVADTIGQAQAIVAVTCNFFNQCTSTNTFKPAFTVGDGTVPVRSATKQGNSFNYNAPNAQLFRYYGPNAGGDDLAEHTGLTQNPLVQVKVLELIAQAAQTSVVAANPARPQAVRLDDPVLPAHYLLINGATAVSVQDPLGNSTAPLQGDLLGSVPGVTHTAIGDQVTMLTLAAGGEYTVTFGTINRPLAVELNTGSDVSVTQVIRYMDLTLPLSVTAMLHLTPGSVEPLKYDADGNGSFETVLTPTVNVSGTAALDILPPTLSFSATISGTTRLLTMTAQDAGSGVKRLSYSLDGTSFQPYAATLVVDPAQTPYVYAFADDNLGNRSSRIQYAVQSGRMLYLPLIRR